MVFARWVLATGLGLLVAQVLIPTVVGPGIAVGAAQAWALQGRAHRAAWIASTEGGALGGILLAFLLSVTSAPDSGMPLDRPWTSTIG